MPCALDACPTRPTPDDLAGRAVGDLLADDLFAGLDVDAQALARGLSAWTLLLGVVTSELFHQLGPVEDPEALFEWHLARARDMFLTPEGRKRDQSTAASTAVCTTRPSGDQPPQGAMAACPPLWITLWRQGHPLLHRSNVDKPLRIANCHPLSQPAVDNCGREARSCGKQPPSCDPPVNAGSAVHSPPEAEAWSPTAGPHDATQPELPRTCLVHIVHSTYDYDETPDKESRPEYSGPDRPTQAFSTQARHAGCTRVCGPPTHRQACGAQSPARASV